MKKAKIIGLILCALLACGSVSALAGCGGNSSGGTASQEMVITAANLVGTKWNVTEIVTNGKTISYDEFATQNHISGYHSVVEFLSETEGALNVYNSDGTRVDSTSMSYTLNDDGTLTVNNARVSDAVIKGDTMEATYDGVKFILKRDDSSQSGASSESTSSQEPIVTLTSLAGTSWTVKEITQNGKTLSYEEYVKENDLSSSRSALEFISDTEAELCDYNGDSRDSEGKINYTLAENGTLTFDNAQISDASLTGDQIKFTYGGLQLTLVRDDSATVPVTSEPSATSSAASSSEASSSEASSSEASSSEVTFDTLAGTTWNVTHAEINGKKMTYAEAVKEMNVQSSESYLDFTTDSKMVMHDWINNVDKKYDPIEYTYKDGKLTFDASSGFSGASIKGKEMVVTLNGIKLYLVNTSRNYTVTSSTASSEASSEASSAPATANAALKGTTWTVKNVIKDGKTMTFEEYAKENNNTDKRSTIEFSADKAEFCDYKASGTRNVSISLPYTLKENGTVSFDNEMINSCTINGNEMKLSMKAFDLVLTKD